LLKESRLHSVAMMSLNEWHAVMWQVLILRAASALDNREIQRDQLEPVQVRVFKVCCSSKATQ